MLITEIFPYLCVINEITLLLSDAFAQHLETGSVSNLHENFDEKLHIVGEVYEMTACTFVLWPPDLDLHALRKHLLSELIFGSLCSFNCASRIVREVGRLAPMISQRFHLWDRKTYSCYHAMVPVSFVRVPHCSQDVRNP